MKAGLLGLGALLAGGALWLSLRQGPAAVQVAAAPGAHAPAPASWGVANPFGAVRSGTINGGAQDLRPADRLVAGPDGHLLLNRRTHQVLDAWLESVHTLPAQQALLHMQAMARAQLREPAAREAATLLAGYMSYQEQMRRVNEAMSSAPHGPQEAFVSMLHLQQAQALRAQLIGAQAAQSLFGEEDALAQYELLSRQLANAQDLSDAERAQKQQALLDGLPPLLREQVQRPRVTAGGDQRPNGPRPSSNARPCARRISISAVLWGPPAWGITIPGRKPSIRHRGCPDSGR